MKQLTIRRGGNLTFRKSVVPVLCPILPYS
ncbi:hypothetical protein EDC40_101773 [Aminobacter aminovorans]|jgi:hypothetical protein|uniref:Uncharacterized protein n=1 Tax=Aminobacter aminovorans TaxID=83263 RepID=A0A380WSF6_AMIAI|nr:hypothetical protein EDC40_101773 [Aminobacter aminovorans]SUU91302.1 Uncharacterised protein [Aminobacter aminovorans]